MPLARVSVPSPVHSVQVVRATVISPGDKTAAVPAFFDAEDGTNAVDLGKTSQLEATTITELHDLHSVQKDDSIARMASAILRRRLPSGLKTSPSTLRSLNGNVRLMNVHKSVKTHVLL